MYMTAGSDTEQPVHTYSVRMVLCSGLTVRENFEFLTQGHNGGQGHNIFK